VFVLPPSLKCCCTHSFVLPAFFKRYLTWDRCFCLRGSLREPCASLRAPEWKAPEKHQFQRQCSISKDPWFGGILKRSHEFWAGRKSSISGVWGAPGASKPMQKDAGLRPAYFCMGCEAPGAPQTPEITDFRPAQNSCIKNPGVLCVTQ
jgi:hypothetical protein